MLPIINELIREIVAHGHRGAGNPVALRDDLSGFWSRQITGDHRLIYAWTGRVVLLAACRFHTG